ncbi:MAG: PD-(D/E)XK nuclease family protein [Bacillota bacterium]
MKRSELVSSAARRMLSAGGPVLHLVPDRRTLSARRDLYCRLAAERGEVLREAPVQMMGGWIRRLSRRFGLWLRRLDPWEQLTLLRLCQKEVELPKGSPLADAWERPGMVSSLHRFVSEARNRGFLTRDLEDHLPSEICRVMKMYEDHLDRHRLADRSRLFRLITESLERDSGFSLDSVVVEGFSRLDYWERRLLETVGRKTGSMDIFMPWDPEMPDVYPPESELRKELGAIFPHVTTYSPAGDSPSLLSGRLFREGGTDDPSGGGPEVRVWTVADERKQNEHLARLIKEQLGSSGLRPGDCCVVVRRLEHLRAVAAQLRRAGVPVCHTDEVSLADTRMGQTMLLLLDLLSDPRAEGMARLASSPYISSEWSLLSRLGAYVRPSLAGPDVLSSLERVRESLAFRLEGGRFRWESPPELEEALEEVEGAIRGLRSLLPLVSIPDRARPLQMCARLAEVLSSLRIRERVEDAVREDGGQTPEILTDLAAQRSFFEQIERGLREVAEQWPGDWDRQGFLLMLRDILIHQNVAVPGSADSFRLNPPEGRGVRLALADEPEIGRYPLVVIPYMVSDVFPARRTPCWIEGSFLPGGGWEDPTSRYRSENELFYRCACAAERHLILIHPAELGETPQVPSPYIHEIEAAGPVTEIDHTREEGRISRAASWRDLRVSLLLQGAGAVEDEMLGRSLAADDIPRALFERVLAAEGERWGPSLGRWDGAIEGADEARCLVDLFPPDARVSPTELNLFAECPFHFFAAQVLDLKGRFAVDWEISAALLGRLYHIILEEYYTERVLEVALKRDAPPGGQAEGLREGVRDACGELRRAMDWLEDSQWQSLNRRVLATLQDLLDFERRRREAATDDEGHLYPWKSEHRFSLRLGDLFPDRPDDALSRIEVRGVMDRVDRTEVPDSPRPDRAVIFDYKLGSNPPGVEQMREGRDLQMPLYVLAARVEFPGIRVVGGGYLSISRAHANSGLYTREAADLLQLDPARNAVSEEDFEQVLALSREFIAGYWDRIRRGDFPVSPVDTGRCRQCRYADLCRFEWERMGRKVRERGQSSVSSD